jgi:hypothetical protein
MAGRGAQNVAKGKLNQVNAGKELLALTWLPWFYVVLTRYSPGAGDYLLGRISDAEFLSRSGVVTPFAGYVNSSTPSDTRIWLWCVEQTFYLERWTRASSSLDKPLFLTWFERFGEQGFSRRLAEAGVDFVLVETSNCQIPPLSVCTEAEEWLVASELRRVIARWMRENLREASRDGSYVLYRVARTITP